MKYDERTVEETVALLLRAFPPSERRTEQGQKRLFEDERYRVITAREGETFLGFIACWEFPQGTFVEHLATAEEVRGRGIGASLVRKVQENCRRPLFLESEPAGSTPFADRRLAFYRRLGFCEDARPYMQPPLQPGQPSIPLTVLTYPCLLQQQEYEDLKNVIWREVYKIGTPRKNGK